METFEQQNISSNGLSTFGTVKTFLDLLKRQNAKLNKLIITKLIRIAESLSLSLQCNKITAL